MDVITVVNDTVQKSLDNKSDGDYTDGEGFLMCGKCHTRKEYESKLFGDLRRVGIACECRKREIEAEEKAFQESRFHMRMDKLREDGITDPAYLEYTFERDDRGNATISDICRNYVEHWPEMKESNTGILFYGGVGTGKTFYAACIANALLDKLVPVSVTSFPRILSRLQSFDDENKNLLSRLGKYSLVVIDDLGVERDTPFALEQVFNVVDARTIARKPLIVTTNMGLEELKNPGNMARQRIYDRILSACPIHLKMAGTSRRAEEAERKKSEAMSILLPKK